MTAYDLHLAVVEVCPIEGVRIGNLLDRSTWLIWFSPEATDEQKSAAEAVLQSFTS